MIARVFSSNTAARNKAPQVFTSLSRGTDKQFILDFDFRNLNGADGRLIKDTVLKEDYLNLQDALREEKTAHATTKREDDATYNDMVASKDAKYNDMVASKDAKYNDMVASKDDTIAGKELALVNMTVDRDKYKQRDTEARAERDYYKDRWNTVKSEYATYKSTYTVTAADYRSIYDQYTERKQKASEELAKRQARDNVISAQQKCIEFISGGQLVGLAYNYAFSANGTNRSTYYSNNHDVKCYDSDNRVYMIKKSYSIPAFGDGSQVFVKVTDVGRIAVRPHYICTSATKSGSSMQTNKPGYMVFQPEPLSSGYPHGIGLQLNGRYNSLWIRAKGSFSIRVGDFEGWGGNLFTYSNKNGVVWENGNSYTVTGGWIRIKLDTGVSATRFIFLRNWRNSRNSIDDDLFIYDIMLCSNT